MTLRDQVSPVLKKESHQRVQRNEVKNCKNTKPTCHFYGKKGHNANVCRSRKTNQQDKPKNKGHCHKCNKQGHQTQDCKTKTMRTQRFDGHYYNCKKYGHRNFECKSKPMWIPNQTTRRNNYAHQYSWDYNTRHIYHYCQEYGHVPKNCIRAHFKGNYSRWLSQTTCLSCLKTSHISRNCPIRAKAPK